MRITTESKDTEADNLRYIRSDTSHDFFNSKVRSSLVQSFSSYIACTTLMQHFHKITYVNIYCLDVSTHNIKVRTRCLGDLVHACANYMVIKSQHLCKHAAVPEATSGDFNGGPYCTVPDDCNTSQLHTPSKSNLP